MAVGSLCQYIILSLNMRVILKKNKGIECFIFNQKCLRYLFVFTTFHADGRNMVRRRKCMFQKTGFLAKNPIFSMWPRFFSKDHRRAWTCAPHMRWTHPEIFFRFWIRLFFVIFAKKSYPPPTAIKSNALAELMNRASKIHWKNLFWL